MAMRPPIPNIALSRRAKIALWTVAILIVLIVALVQLTGVYINFLWFRSLGFSGVYTTIFWTRATLFAIFGVLMALILGGNIVIAYLLSPPFRPMSAEQQNIERYRTVLEPRRFLVLAAICVIALFSAGLSAQNNWATWQLWLHGSSFGQTDPQFHMDVSFYAFDYPAYRLLLGFGFTALVFAILLSAMVHYLTGAIRLQTPGPKVTPAARRHLTLLVFVFVLLKAIAYWLDRYGLVFSDRSKFTGASYTDVHAVLPARTILFWIALIIAAGLIASLWLRNSMLPAIAFVSMLVLSILISGIYPAILQGVSVKPNAAQKEALYIERNINATRAAYGIGDDKVDYKQYAALDSPKASALSLSNPTVGNIRILDPNEITQAFTQQQRIKNVYGFPAKLDIDRYNLSGTPSGEQDYVVGVRELDNASLNGTQLNWISQHTVYTHGYGFVAAPANSDVTNDASLYSAGDIPPSGPLSAGLKQPEVYYGELLPDYSIVGAKGKSSEYNASDGPRISYQGGGGVPLSSFMTRLAFAVNYKQTNFVLNDVASGNGAHIIFNRDPRVMVQKVAPFLKVDGDPYPFIGPNGDIEWMVDGYTTMDGFPYSQHNSLSTLTSDSLSTNDKTARQPNDQINYIRNSVKATVDAYTGKVTLYAWDPTDPLLKAWMSVFQGLVQPRSSMPSDVMAHVRYPEDLFKVQRSLLGTYHVDNAQTFYSSTDKWTVPVDPNTGGANQPPYYVVAAAPGSNDLTTPQFQLTTPMIVNNNQNMAAYLSVDSDPGPNYGRITALTVPSDRATRGPELVASILKSNPTISQNITLLNGAGGGSEILDGNLLTLPVGNSFLYVEPLYVQATASNASYPQLARVLVVYGNRDSIGFEPSLSQALTDLQPGHTLGEQLPGNGVSTRGNGGSGGTKPPPKSSTSPGPTPPPASGSSVGEQQVRDAIQAAQRALQKEQELLNQYFSQQSSSSPPKSPSTSPSSAPKPSGSTHR